MYPLLMSRKVKGPRRKGITRLSSKNQATIPVSVLREAAIGAGDTLRIEASGPGEVRLVRVPNRIERFSGSLAGVYPKGYLKKLRGEWR
jgi:bifunctional DNA-binding transcriptional regulator/antitoxin component of YhaV-PrlF toxin-antitoxin module